MTPDPKQRQSIQTPIASHKDPAALPQTQCLDAGQPQTIPEARRSGLKDDHKGHLARQRTSGESSHSLLYDKGRDSPYAAFASRNDNRGNAP